MKEEKNLKLIASNLTIAFYNGQISREPFFGEDKRKNFYSLNDENRIPTISQKEVFSVYKNFLKMLESE
ncbi:MAG: hypothetical protein AAB336_04195 [Acidobacteriota bacterium]